MEKLIKEIGKLEQIPQESIITYEENMYEMVERVNFLMSKKKNLLDLIGGNPITIMYDNHRYHAEFMLNVFKLCDYDMIVRTIPWVISSHTSRGFQDAYFHEELNVWIEAILEYMGINNSKEIIGVHKWIIKRYRDLKQIEVRELEFPASFDLKNVNKRFLDALLKNDDKLCIKIADEYVKDLESFGRFYSYVVQNSMYEIGKMWELNKISVAQEHLATSMVLNVMSIIYNRFTFLRNETEKGKAIVTIATNECHEIGARMLADMLELRGWDVYYLGANTPVSDMVAMVKDKKPLFVCISVTMTFNVHNVVELIKGIREDREIEDTKIMVGGQAFNINPELFIKIGADAFKRNLIGAIELAEEWLKEVRD